MAKVNEKNLIPNSARTPEQLREMTTKGGKRSGEVRRAKRDLKDRMKSLLALPVNDFDDYNGATAMGVDLSEIDNETILIVNLYKKAKSGDVQAFKEIRNLLGQDLATEEMKIKKKEFELKEKDTKSNKTVEDDELTKSLEERAKKL